MTALSFYSAKTDAITSLSESSLCLFYTGVIQGGMHMHYLREFGKLCVELLAEADCALLLIFIFLVYRRCSLQIMISAAVIYTTLQWLVDWHIGALAEDDEEPME